MKLHLVKPDLIYPKVVHPFNLQNQGKETYAKWQYRKGEDTIRFFLFPGEFVPRFIDLVKVRRDSHL